MLRQLAAALSAFLLASSPAVTLADGVVKIAVLGPMAFVHGESHWAGAELARDEINAAGGIAVRGGRLKIELLRVDTNELLSVPDAVNAMERAITRDKADVLVGGFRSEAVLAMQEVAMDHKKLFLGCGAADVKLGTNVEKEYGRYKYWFRVLPPNSPALGRTLFTVLGDIAGQVRRDLKKEAPRVAILAEKLLWTEAILAAARTRLPEMGLEVVGLWQPSPTATDVSAELAAIDRTGADLVLTALSGPVGIVVARQMGERHMRATAFGVNIEAQKTGFWEATAGRGNYVATLDAYAEVELTPATVAFVRAFTARYRKMPTYTAGTYDAIKLLREASEKAGTIDADELVPVIETMRFVGTGGILEYDRAHDPIWGPGKVTGIAVQWQDGKKVPFWPAGVKGMKPFKLPAQR